MDLNSYGATTYKLIEMKQSMHKYTQQHLV